MSRCAAAGGQNIGHAFALCARELWYVTCDCLSLWSPAPSTEWRLPILTHISTLRQLQSCCSRTSCKGRSVTVGLGSLADEKCDNVCFYLFFWQLPQVMQSQGTPTPMILQGNCNTDSSKRFPHILHSFKIKIEIETVDMNFGRHF